MKKLIFFFLILLVAVWVGLILQANPGYVLISYGHTRIETTFWFALLLLILLFMVLYASIRLLRGAYKIPMRYSHWMEQRNEQSSRQLTQQARCDLMEGNLKKGEAQFMRAAKKDPSWLVNYMGAAYSAQLQKKYAKRDEYLQQALKMCGPKVATAVNIQQGDWQLQGGQTHAAWETFLDLQRVAPHQPRVLHGLKEVYLALQNWDSLGELLPQLQRYKVMDNAELLPLQQKVYLELLSKAAQHANVEALDRYWNSLSKTWQQDAVLLAAYTSFLIKRNRHKEAEKLLKLALRKNLDVQLLRQYARVLSDDPARQLARAEEWLAKNPSNADLLLCLGHLCVRLRLWGKARSYFEASIKLDPRFTTYYNLGYVMEQLGDKTAAVNCYSAGLNLVAQ